MKKSSRGLANPVKLNPVAETKGFFQVVIETPKGSRNKFAFDPVQKVFTLSRILPAGMDFPLDFGFVPRTKAPDGDPLDVLLIMDEPCFPGIVVNARLVGIMEGEQVRKDGKKSRNDRLLAVAEATQTYVGLNDVKQVPQVLLTQLERFFMNYHQMEGLHYKALGWKGADAAKKILEKLKT